MTCIFCDKPVNEPSEEHIVPESLGNVNYILSSGYICRVCNNDFSEFEEKALSKTMLGFERSRLGIVTKKGKAAKAQSHNIKVSGDPKFRKNIVTFHGLEEKDVVDNGDGTFNIKVLDFDKSAMSASKLLLKIGLESLFQSQRYIFNSHNFMELKKHLTKIDNSDWPIITPSKNSKSLNGFQSIPRFIDKKRLKDIRCEILYKELDENTFLLNFRYSVLSYVVNLKSRGINWCKPFFEVDQLANIYPEHLKKKLNHISK